MGISSLMQARVLALGGGRSLYRRPVNHHDVVLFVTY